MSTLNDIDDLNSAYAINLSESCPVYIKKRLLSLGFCNRHRLTVIRKAPLGCPLEIEVLDTRVLLRKNEAQHVIVEERL